MNARAAGPIGHGAAGLRPRIALALAGAIMAASGVALWMAAKNLDAPRQERPTPAPRSPIEQAIHKRDLDGLKRLITSGESGGEALREAVDAGWTDGVIVLLNAGAEVTPVVIDAARARTDDTGRVIAAMIDAAK